VDDRVEDRATVAVEAAWVAVVAASVPVVAAWVAAWVATGAAVGTTSIGVRYSTVPQAGQRALFPAEAAGAFNFLPQEHRTVIEPSPDIPHPLPTTKQKNCKITRRHNNNAPGACQDNSRLFYEVHFADIFITRTP
jgi:hypothetical protein